MENPEKLLVIRFLDENDEYIGNNNFYTPIKIGIAVKDFSRVKNNKSWYPFLWKYHTSNILTSEILNTNYKIIEIPNETFLEILMELTI